MIWAGLDTPMVRKLLVDKLGLETESDLIPSMGMFRYSASLLTNGNSSVYRETGLG